MPNLHHQYLRRRTAEVAEFVKALQENTVKNGIFDSADATEFVNETIQRGEGGAKIPASLDAVFDEAGDDSAKICKAILDGVQEYRLLHGVDAPSDVVEHAIHLAYSTSDLARRRYVTDSASSTHHDQWSLQPNRAVVAILTAIAEAIPFAHYLPADIGSNEAKLAIMSHIAGKEYGLYAEGGLMDGVLSGGQYINSARTHVSFPDGSGNVAGQIGGIQSDEETSVTVAGNLILRGRTTVYVQGLLAAREIESTGTGNSTISGSIEISGTTYQIGGYIQEDGVYALTTTPALPTTIPVTVEGYMDYERTPELTPSIISRVDTFTLYAAPWRVNTSQTIDSRTQMSNELGLDPYSEGVLAIQTQFANERHYDVLYKARRIAANNSADYDFEWASRSATLSRAEIWADFAHVLNNVSQQMAIDTLNHGVTHLYVGKNIASQFMALPRTVFEPSGIMERPGIFRIGRLFGRYEVYYTPKGVTETATSGQILCIGRATDVTRNPFVLGDAVAPTVIPLAVNADLKQGAGFYARNYTSVNPHKPSALGCAVINVINLA